MYSAYFNAYPNTCNINNRFVKFPNLGKYQMMINNIQKDKLYFWKKFFVKQISDFPDCPKCIKKGVRIVMSEDNGLVCPLCDYP